MKQTALIMGMPISVEVLDTDANGEIFKKIFNYLEWVDEKFSTYKSQSEISRINRGELLLKQASTEMKEVFELSEKTKKETLGYFDICNPC
jgi:thiamine biosynthesis lipoprotein